LSLQNPGDPGHHNPVRVNNFNEHFIDKILRMINSLL
jgi:hypothetical protein